MQTVKCERLKTCSGSEAEQRAHFSLSRMLVEAGDQALVRLLRWTLDREQFSKKEVCV